MFEFLSKFLPAMIYPIGLICVLLSVGLLLSKQTKILRMILFLTLIILFLGGNRWVALNLARSLEWRYMPPDPVPHVEALVVLGGGTEAKEYPRQIAEINSAGDRIIYAAYLYRQGKADAILVSGGLLDWEEHASTPAEEMRDLLQMMGVPANSIWLETQSRDTRENAAFSAKILNDRRIDRILLVTSASHMPRAVKLFEAQGFEVIPAPVDYRVSQRDIEQLRRLDIRSLILGSIPSAENLQMTTSVMKEYLGMMIYAIRGWK